MKIYPFTGASLRSAEMRRRILGQLAAGCTTSAEIARALNVGQRTVYRHAKHLANKGKIRGERGVGYMLTTRGMKNG